MFIFGYDCAMDKVGFGSLAGNLEVMRRELARRLESVKPDEEVKVEGCFGFQFRNPGLIGEGDDAEAMRKNLQRNLEYRVGNTELPILWRRLKHMVDERQALAMDMRWTYIIPTGAESTTYDLVFVAHLSQKKELGDTKE